MPHSHSIGMIITDIANPFFPLIVRGAEDVFAELGYRMLLGNTDNDADKELTTYSDMQTYNPAGFLIIPAPNSIIQTKLGDRKKPMVFIDREPANWSGDVVSIDNEMAAFQATNLLLSAGHKRVAIITGPLRSLNARQRLAGYEKACRAKGLIVDLELRREAHFRSDSGYTAAKSLLQMVPRPTAIFASNDLIAAGALIAIRHAGLNCPKDVSVVGFDNLEFAELTDPGLTTVHQPAYQMGMRAARILIARIKTPELKPERVILGTELRIRESVAPPAGTVAARLKRASTQKRK